MVTIIPDVKDEDGVWVKSVCISKTKYTTVSGKKWHQIQTRCKEGGRLQELEPSYIGCSMSDNFKDFQFFAAWHTLQVGYGIEGYQLDKDILLQGNKVYSEDTCVLVPQALNNFLLSRDAARGAFPQGVFWHKTKKKFIAQISTESSRKHLGAFNDVTEASQAYRAAKERHARKWYERLRDGEFVVDLRVVERLRTWTFEEVLFGK